MILQPQPGPQTAFLSTAADVALYGGAAGGGKSYALLLEMLRNIAVPGFTSVIFRRTAPEITNPGGLWDETVKMYPHLRAIPNQSARTWTFPGTRNEIKLGYMQYDIDLIKWFGSQIALICFDELTSFTRKQFFEMLARNRSACGVKPYMRASCNPDPESWVLELVDWYIDAAGDPIPERSGVLRWFIQEQDTLIWASSADELKVQYPESEPLSFTFIPAKLDDNKILSDADPGYRAKLRSLPTVRRAALLFGNWRTKSAGKMFKREWFSRNRVQPEDVPDMVRVVIGVDPSGGHGPGNDEQGIFACGKGRNGLYYVLEDATVKLSPAGWGGQTVDVYHRRMADAVAAENNYGGEMVESNIRTIDPHVNVKLVRASRGKAVRAEPIAALCEKDKIKFVGVFPEMEDEAVGFDPDETGPSPNRMDAWVWAITELMGTADPSVLAWLKADVEADAHAENEAFNQKRK